MRSHGTIYWHRSHFKKPERVKVNNFIMARSKKSNFVKGGELNNLKPEGLKDKADMKYNKITKKDHQEFEMMSSNLNVEAEEKQILVTLPVGKGHSVLSNKQELAVNVVELPEEKSSGKCGLDVYNTGI